MGREIELRRLPMSNKSALVVTNVRVYHDKDNGMLGQERTSIRREAITSVQIRWKRSEGLLLTGIALLGVYFLIWMASLFINPVPIASELRPPELAEKASLTLNNGFQYVAGFFSSALASVVKYALLFAGIGMLVAFRLHKLSEVRVVGSGVTIKGNPKSYEEGSRLCEFLFSILEPSQSTIPRDEAAKKTGNVEKPPQGSKPQEKDWQL